ncbi:hypothetical protein IFT73_17445 [Aeromicrobium sp. CFBP 8757]|uniref:hypothetical protein n=1 Tax=Aeromicrobium sp. CFBP 8757 TaxID=2775288 RepID=UPI001783E831|nr:hypothetical protein [Aeromicrobium sp. CFBP 8757]MBD8608642.1 hypothetical protein [Aeromicrobium sp. CFBP 8757]
MVEGGRPGAYRRWLDNAVRRGVEPETVGDVVRRHGILPDDVGLLDRFEELVDPDGKSFHLLPDDIGADDARRAVLMTYVVNAGTGYGTSGTDLDFDETPYSAAEVGRIAERQRANDWTYRWGVSVVHSRGGRLVTTPNGMLMGLGGDRLLDVLSQRGGTTYGDLLLLNIARVDAPAELRALVWSGRSRHQAADGSTRAGRLDLDRLLHHEERHARQWADKGPAGFVASYLWERLVRRNDTEEDAGLRDGGYR